jgi:ParB family chromosome partitioning protein
MSNRKSHRPLNSKIEVPWDPSEDLLIHSGSSTSPERVRLQEIYLPANQPRRYFDPQAQQKLVESVREHGILQPLLVRPRQAGGYELVAGERRYRAAESLGLIDVPVVKKELNDAEAFQLALIENLQREDLNPLEETEGILHLLSIKLQQPLETIPALLHRLQHQQKESASKSANNVIGKQPSVNDSNSGHSNSGHSNSGHSSDPSPSNNVIGSENPEAKPLSSSLSSEQTIVEQVFKTLGRMTWESFINNRLPLLNLPGDVLEAVRYGDIAYTKARALAQIKEQQIRKTALERAIAEDWSLENVKTHVKAHLRTLKPQSDQAPLRQQFEATYRKVKQAKLWEDPRRQERFKALLAELESLLEDESRG